MKFPSTWSISLRPSLFTQSRLYGIRHQSTTATDPLRILFCGSEEFSIASLRAVHKEHVVNPALIASIDVVCKPGKRTGRGLKHVREVPIKAVAKELQLRLHEIDTFTGWNPPQSNKEPINLIVTVSFGLLIPPRILQGAKYRGLNVHPSLLPDFRGPAPLHHTLLSSCKTTGITLQTLHPSKFDHGEILAQTPSPGFAIPNPESCTVSQLLQHVAPKGAEMLVQSLRDGAYNRPRDVSVEHNVSPQSDTKSYPYRHAPKISAEDSHIDWMTWSADEIVRRNRVLGPLWNMATIVSQTSTLSNSTPPSPKRIIFSSIRSGKKTTDSCGSEPTPFKNGLGDPALHLKTCDGNYVTISRAKVEGGVEMDAAKAVERLGGGPGKKLLCS